MPIRLSNIRLGVDTAESELLERAARLLGVRAGDIERWRILRKSLDLRDKDDISFVYSLEVAPRADEERLLAQSARRTGSMKAEQYREPAFDQPIAGSEPLPQRPIVIGSGPAGQFAAYFLAEAGYRPLVLERGRAVRERIADMRAFDAGAPHNPESNYLFGEGGAGTFSDGKLTCRASGPDVRRVLEVFVDCKADASILYDHRPHLGSNRLPGITKALRQKIIALGGEFRFDCRLEDVDVADGAIRGIATSSGHLPASVLVLAIGHSARDTYEMLFRRGVPMAPKPFQIGLRIEQPQEQVNRFQYGRQSLEEKLGAADYTVIARGANNVFSFCMCAGGFIMPSVSEPGHFCTNGMSLSRRDSPFANSGLMITLEPADFVSQHVLAGMLLQRSVEAQAYALGGEAYLCPIQRALDYVQGKATTDPPESSYPRGVIAADVGALVPPKVAEAIRWALPLFDRRWRGEFLREATLVGPETRGSSPVRFLRHELTQESTGIAGLYPIGEGAGYAGGIVSAALDGLRAARAIIRRYASLERPVATTSDRARAPG